MNKIVSLALAAAAAVAAVPALAQSVSVADDGSFRAAVSYSDLNLATPAGQRALHGRLKTAANIACGGEGYLDVESVRAAADCRKSFMAAARPKVDIASRSQGNGSISIAASR
jgi:UrcA family protein